MVQSAAQRCAQVVRDHIRYMAYAVHQLLQLFQHGVDVLLQQAESHRSRLRGSREVQIALPRLAHSVAQCCGALVHQTAKCHGSRQRQGH